MLSHDNLSFDAQVSLECGFEGIRAGLNVISVLPYSHIYEHVLIYIYLLAAVRYYICHDPNELLVDLRDVRPAEMTAVPRIFDRVLAGIKGQSLHAGGLQRRLIPWAVAIGRGYSRATELDGGASPWLRMQYGLAKRLVLDKIRHRLGLDNVRFLTSGSAALHVDTAMTFLGLGVPIMQGYGLTETSPVVSVSRLSANEWGAVGRPLTGVEVRIAEDGEVLVRGRNVMQGYYRDAEATAASIPDGWLHTGDVGEMDGRGFLRITDRKREIFKTSTGKWISPAQNRGEHPALRLRRSSHGDRKRPRASHRADLPELVAAALGTRPPVRCSAGAAGRASGRARLFDPRRPQPHALVGRLRAGAPHHRYRARVQRRGRRAFAGDEDQAASGRTALRAGDRAGLRTGKSGARRTLKEF